MQFSIDNYSQLCIMYLGCKKKQPQNKVLKGGATVGKGTIC